jgi:hypothetical protein
VEFFCTQVSSVMFATFDGVPYADEPAPVVHCVEIKR